MTSSAMMSKRCSPTTRSPSAPNQIEIEGSARLVGDVTRDFAYFGSPVRFLVTGATRTAPGIVTGAAAGRYRIIFCLVSRLTATGPVDAYRRLTPARLRAKRGADLRKSRFRFFAEFACRAAKIDSAMLLAQLVQ